MAKTERIEIRANEEFLNELDRLAGDNSSRADVIRRAVVLYSAAKRQEIPGHIVKLLVRDETANQERELISF